MTTRKTRFTLGEGFEARDQEADPAFEQGFESWGLTPPAGRRRRPSRARAGLAELGDMRVHAFGHVGDGNLHLNIFPAAGKTKGDYANLKGAIGDLVHDLAVSLEGSFSAEHGIGRLKVEALERYADPGKLAAMRAIKVALDPHGIMNPGAVLAVT